MKKTVLFTLITSILLFTGCQDPIFESIRQDVEPEEATVSGNISTITRYTAGGKEFLALAADDGLRYKFKDYNTHGEWNTYPLPFALHAYDFNSSSHSGEQALAVVANSTTLYVISASYSHTTVEGLSYPSEIKLWGKNIKAKGDEWDESGNWKLITKDQKYFPIVLDSYGKHYQSRFGIMQTNAPIQAHREAFLRVVNPDNESTYAYYRLNGLNAPEEYTLDPNDIIDPEDSPESSYIPIARSVVYFNGELKFFSSPTATTNETYTDEASFIYYTNGDEKLYYDDGTGPGSINTSGYVISSLAACKDAILVGYGNFTAGSAGGIDKVSLKNGKPHKVVDFDTNAKFQITNSYMVLALLNATPEKKEIDSDLYASITFAGTALNFSNIGLWSYYPDRGNWNRE